MTVYLDCNATTPLDPIVREAVVHYMAAEFGNAGSRTHEHGQRAQAAVQRARRQVAAVAAARAEEVIFTSGATESNNLALLGLASHGEQTGRRHLVSTAIEHRAVLGPLEALKARGFAVTLIKPTAGGWVDPGEVLAAVRADTLAVSVMHANNETGVLQPIAEIAEGLVKSDVYLHVDAAQSFGREIEALRNPRLDLISVSGHKLFAPKGIGALIARRRDGRMPPLSPLMFGGHQERGLRPGTLPVHLIVGLGVAAAAAMHEADMRAAACRAFRERALSALAPLGPVIHGDPSRALPHVLNLSFPGVDAEALMVGWKGLIAVSNGAACSVEGYLGSHVLHAMGLPQAATDGAVRLSWSHRTEEPDWGRVVEAVQRAK
ncbi:MAG: aminotransferase class V-fold PLP-dependent enzyme [Minicystis sp.]